MYHARNEKQQMIHDGRNGTANSRLRMLREKETYLGILEVDTIKEGEIKEKFKKRYPRRIRKLLEIKL